MQTHWQITDSTARSDVHKDLLLFNNSVAEGFGFPDTRFILILVLNDMCRRGDSAFEHGLPTLYFTAPWPSFDQEQVWEVQFSPAV